MMHNNGDILGFVFTCFVNTIYINGLVLSHTHWSFLKTKTNLLHCIIPVSWSKDYFAEHTKCEVIEREGAWNFLLDNKQY